MLRAACLLERQIEHVTQGQLHDEIAERCLDVLLERHPDAGPVVSQDTSTGQLRITATVIATDPWSASNFGARVIGGSLDEAQIPEAPIEDITITAL